MLLASEWCSAVAKGSDFAFADSSWKTLLHLIKLLPSFLFFMVVQATVPHSLFTFISYVCVINGRCRSVEWASISEGEIIISLADAGPLQWRIWMGKLPYRKLAAPQNFILICCETPDESSALFPAKKALATRSQYYVCRKLSILNVLEHN